MKLTIGDWILLACIIAGTVVLLGLGTWQVQRLAWKEAMIDRVEANRSAAPIAYDALFPLEETAQDIEYRPVTVTGRFLHDREQYFFATYEGTTGRYVYTPLERADGSLVWVNRGFIPQGFQTPARSAPVSQGQPVEVTGLAREAPIDKPNSFFPDNEPKNRLFFWKDRDAMSASAGLDIARVLPYFVDADRDGAQAARRPDGGLAYPLGGVTRVEFPNNHLQYIVTWYGLALTLILVGGSFFWRRRRDAEPSGEST